ncbi:MAG: tRNA1(Val) (adenine(37)-N6)-methyltransferase [Clostridia bacterium]|nr:tRNA1(Val) (adenine(37)-N6)-methyltransferase [Clostridia bacterium]
MERTDDLGLNGLKLIQDTDLFCFGTDSVLLSDFARAAGGSTVVDLCTGNGIIPVLLSAKTKAAKIYGMELQKPSFDLAVMNAELNDLSPRVEFIHDDIKNWNKYFTHGSVDAVTCNPPYMPVNSGFTSLTDEKAIARHEIMINIDWIIEVSSKLLKFGGHIYMVHRADRLCDVITAMRSRKIEPKRLVFIHPSPEKAPNLILVDGMLGANPSLKIENPIYVNI